MSNASGRTYLLKSKDNYMSSIKSRNTMLLPWYAYSSHVSLISSSNHDLRFESFHEDALLNAGAILIIPSFPSNAWIAPI
jgi:hypothetical protein